ncbi:MAG TPA: ribonuclease III [Pseudomonadales bacterium]
MKQKLEALSRRIGYSFADLSLLELAMTHRSVSGAKNNERLEFLGDAIVNFIIAGELYRQYPQLKEGKLSRLRAQLVRGETLAELSRNFNLGDCLVLGSGELKSGGYRRDSILADAMEALIGAVYLDSGLDNCQVLVLAWYRDLLANIAIDEPQKDPKTLLQEYLQAHKKSLPQYTVTSLDGAAHEQVFTVECFVAGLAEPTCGKGSSRRQAEQEAAAEALHCLQSP